MNTLPLDAWDVVLLGFGDHDDAEGMGPVPGVMPQWQLADTPVESDDDSMPELVDV